MARIEMEVKSDLEELEENILALEDTVTTYCDCAPGVETIIEGYFDNIFDLLKRCKRQ